MRPAHKHVFKYVVSVCFLHKFSTRGLRLRRPHPPSQGPDDKSLFYLSNIFVYNIGMYRVGHARSQEEVLCIVCLPSHYTYLL